MKDAPLIDMETLEEVAPVLRILSHPLRLRILDYLKEGERTVREITDALEKPQALTSHHLSIMRNQGVIAARREGAHVYYSVKKRASLGLLECIRNARREG